MTRDGARRESAGNSGLRVRAGRGLFEPGFALGDTVRAGNLAGWIHFPEEPERVPRAPHFAGDGMVVCRRVPSLVAPGNCLAHLASDL